jgi:hypothetical protein
MGFDFAFVYNSSGNLILAPACNLRIPAILG